MRGWPQGAGDSRGGGGGAHKQQRPDAHRRSVHVIITIYLEFLSFKCQVKCSAIFDIWSTNGFLLVIVIQSWAPSSFHELRSHAIVTLRRVSDNCKIPTLNSLQFPCSLLPQTWSLWDCEIASLSNYCECDSWHAVCPGCQSAEYWQSNILLNRFITPKLY